MIVSVPTDVYFVLAMFMEKPHLKYSSWSFRPIYSKFSLLSAITTWSSENCSVYIVVLSSLYPIPKHFLFQVFKAFSTWILNRVGDRIPGEVPMLPRILLTRDLPF
jgi:hypothetical protein